MSTTHHIILFYKYHPLSPDENVTEKYRFALEKLCQTLELRGRILVGCAESEGINGTLAGASKEQVLAFTYALLDPQHWTEPLDGVSQKAVEEYRQSAQSFFASIGRDVLTMESPQDFKWSQSNTSSADEQLFPDLNIKLVKELIGTGGVLSNIQLSETAQGYLTPAQWHAELQSAQQKDDTILIDCRNTKEFQIGHFAGAVDPKTTTFQQFPKWVKDHQHLLQDKKIRMYCTGGIRCEKVRTW